MKRILFLMVLGVALCSCTKDNDDVEGTLLEGKWELTNVSCFCGFGVDTDFSGHKITFEGDELTVENSGQFEFLTDAAGKFTVEGNVITFVNGRQYTYEVKLNVLELTFVDNPGIADDEIFMAYKRG